MRRHLWDQKGEKTVYRCVRTEEEIPVRLGRVEEGQGARLIR